MVHFWVYGDDTANKVMEVATMNVAVSFPYWVESAAVRLVAAAGSAAAGDWDKVDKTGTPELTGAIAPMTMKMYIAANATLGA